MQEVDKYFEDFELGETRMTDARTITETDIVFHAVHSGDFMPHHVDAEWCKSQPFKKPFAHGKGNQPPRDEVVCFAEHVIHVEKRTPSA